MSETAKHQYEALYDCRFTGSLGFGRDGDVFSTNHNTAVKFFTSRDVFTRERIAYDILSREKVEFIAGHRVPQFIRANEDLPAIEMTIAKPPFFLDFASAYHPADVPDFPDDVWETWYAEKREEFGDRWSDVQLLMNEFERITGLVLLDINPGNVKFA